MMHMYSIVHKRGGTYVLRRRRRRREVAVRTARAPCGPTRQQRMPTSAAHAATAALGPAPAASPPDQGRDGRTWTQPRPAAQKQGGQGGTIDSAPAPAGSALEATQRRKTSQRWPRGYRRAYSCFKTENSPSARADWRGDGPRYAAARFAHAQCHRRPQPADRTRPYISYSLADSASGMFDE